MNNTSTKTLLLMRGNDGASVTAFKQALSQSMGKRASDYPGLVSGNTFDADTEAALCTWQAEAGLVADGIAGPRTQSALGLKSYPAPKITVDAATIKPFFPGTRYSSIATNLPYSLRAD